MWTKLLHIKCFMKYLYLFWYLLCEFWAAYTEDFKFNSFRFIHQVEKAYRSASLTQFQEQRFVSRYTVIRDHVWQYWVKKRNGYKIIDRNGCISKAKEHICYSSYNYISSNNFVYGTGLSLKCNFHHNLTFKCWPAVGLTDRQYLITISYNMPMT